MGLNPEVELDNPSKAYVGKAASVDQSGVQPMHKKLHGAARSLYSPGALTVTN
jgi:hypothetical protein